MIKNSHALLLALKNRQHSTVRLLLHHEADLAVTGDLSQSPSVTALLN
jgi:hypothetical protein